MLFQLSSRAFKFKNVSFLIIDLCIFACTPFVALWIRLESEFEIARFGVGVLLATTIFIFVKILCTSIFGGYRRYWRLATLEDLLRLAAACTVICVIESLILGLAHLNLQSDIYLLPRSFPLLDGLLTFLGIAAARASVKLADSSLRQRHAGRSRDRVLVYGAGDAGVALVDAMRQREQAVFFPVAFVDDDPKKRDLKIRDIPVLGGRDQLLSLVMEMKAARVIIAMPSASGQTIREIAQICHAHQIPTSTLPNLHDIVNGGVTLRSIREIKIEDLLRRDTVLSGLGHAALTLRGKRVLVTGAGGSIGSEICRQVLQCTPAELILMGHGENSVFLIHQELTEKLLKEERPVKEPLTQLHTLIADIKDRARLNHALNHFKPDFVFHAAAHKHVPLMEMNPSEAITNNVMGTQNLVEAAISHGVQQLVMISTDKAVNPSSVMGASKRLGELLVLDAAKRYHRQFCVVRFGNVLGSRGSVVPIFKQQIERGGPITITHPDVTRYFMTIPEAVHLVLQAMVLSQEGEVFMLNMGRPVKIVDLAQDLIRLSGYQVDSDIKIVYTGLRPGEKLHEELLLAGEAYEPTPNENLLVVKNAEAQVPAELNQEVRQVIQAAINNNEMLIRATLERLIPESQIALFSSAEPLLAGTPVQHWPGGADRLDNLLEYPSASPPTYPPTHPSAAPPFVWPIPTRASLPPSEQLSFWQVADLESQRSDSRSICLGPDKISQELSKAQPQDFRVLYQPILLLQNAYLVESFEALLHWQHLEYGLIRSSQFIKMADQIGSIHEIGLWGVRAVCHQLSELESLRPHPTFTISVNLSKTQLRHPALTERLAQMFQETQVNVARLCFEIPEQFIAVQGEGAIATLLRMKGLGVRLLLDNFGFSPEKQLSPVMEWLHLFDGFKIDRSRIHDLAQDPNSLNFFRTALDLSKHWGLDMIATGIESTQQLTQLKNLHCKYGQGYFFLRPIEGRQVRVLLEEQSAN